MVENTNENLHEVIIRYGCGEKYEYSITIPTGMSLEETVCHIEAETRTHQCHQCEIDVLVERLAKGLP